MDLWNFIEATEVCVHFIFAIKMKPLKNYQKCFLFYQKSSCCPRNFKFLYLTLPLFFLFLAHFWFYWRSWLMINTKVYGISMSLNLILKTWFFNIWWIKVLILMLGQQIEYYIEKIFMEKFGCPTVNFSPQSCSLHVIHLLYFIWTKGPREPWNDSGSQSLVKYVIRVRT